MATNNELLQSAKAIDSKLAGRKVTIQPHSKETLFEEDDAFSGNENNRKVAERAAGTTEQAAQAAANAGIVQEASQKAASGKGKGKGKQAAADAPQGKQAASSATPATVPTWTPDGK